MAKYVIIGTGPAGIVLDNVSIRTQGKSSANSASFLQARFDVGLYPRDTGYSAGIEPNGRASISITGGNARAIAQAQSDMDPTQEDLLMQFDVFGTELRFYAWRPDGPFPTEPVVSVTDGTIMHEGDIILGMSRTPTGAHFGDFRFFQVATEPIPIPEPSSAVLIGLGLIGLAACRRRRFT